MSISKKPFSPTADKVFFSDNIELEVTTPSVEKSPMFPKAFSEKWKLMVFGVLIFASVASLSTIIIKKYQFTSIFLESNLQDRELVAIESDVNNKAFDDLDRYNSNDKPWTVEVALKTYWGTYLRASSGGEGALINTQTYIGPWERFTLEAIPEEKGVFAIRTYHGNYIRAREGQNAKVDTQTYNGPWEKFTIEWVDRSGVCAIRTSHGDGEYLRAWEGTYANVDIQTFIGPWERFTLVYL